MRSHHTTTSRAHLLAALGLLLATALPDTALANTPLLGTLGGPEASPTTPSPTSVYWNPAMISVLPDNQLHADVNLDWRMARYTPSTSGDANTLLSFDVQPMLAGSRRLGNTGLTLGLGIFSPYLERSRWQDEQGEQRWFGIFSNLRTLAIAPTLSYALFDKLSIGASMQLTRVLASGYSAVDYGQIVAEQRDRDDIPQYAPGNEGRAYGDFKGNAGVFDVGLRWAPSARTTVGLSYTSQSDVQINGKYSVYAPRNAYFQSADFGDAEEKKATLAFTLPRAVRLGLSQDLSETFTVRLGVDYIQWSALDTITIDVSNEPLAGIASPDRQLRTEWRDVVAARVGFTSRSDSGKRWFGQLGFESSPVKQETLSPALIAGSHIDAALGTSFPIGKSGRHMGIAYTQRVMIPRSVETSSLSPSAAGDYLDFQGMLNLSFDWAVSNRPVNLPEVESAVFDDPDLSSTEDLPEVTPEEAPAD